MYISSKIPEFDQGHDKDEYEKRLKGKKNLVLIAEIEGMVVGFKVGYQETNYFYSWMGAVIPEFRKLGVAKKLAEEQEKWVEDNGIKTIRFKTQNKFKYMLIFAIMNGFRIIGTMPFDGGEGFKILLEKEL